MGPLSLLVLIIWPSPTFPSCDYTFTHTGPSLQTTRDSDSTTGQNATSLPRTRRFKKPKPNQRAPTGEEEEYETLSLGSLNIKFGIEGRLLDLEMLIHGVPGGQPALQVLAIQEAQYLQATTQQPIWAIPVFDENTPDLGFLYNPNLEVTRVTLTSKYALAIKLEQKPMPVLLINIHPQRLATGSHQEVVDELTGLINRFPLSEHIFFLLGDFNVDVAHGQGANYEALRRALDSNHFRVVSPATRCTHTWRKTKELDSPRSLIDFIWLAAPNFWTPTHIAGKTGLEPTRRIRQPTTS